MPRRPKTSPLVLRQQLKAQQALDMRLEGKEYSEIARALGYANGSGPYNAIQSLMRRYALESLSELRDVEGARLDKMLAAVWARATTGDLDAIDTVLKIQQRRARLFGLDRPVRIDVDLEPRQTVILKIGDQPPRVIDLKDLDLTHLSVQELEMLRQLQTTKLIEGEVLHIAPPEQASVGE